MRPVAGSADGPKRARAESTRSATEHASGRTPQAVSPSQSRGRRSRDRSASDACREWTFAVTIALNSSPALIADGRAPSVWLVSPVFDWGVFVVPSLVALTLAALGGRLAENGTQTPAWAWLLFVVGIDVAHVHATTLRVYCDPAELRRRLGLYTGVPLLSLGLSALAYAASAALFWRCLAYLALFHFVRQQIGWTRLYRRRAQDRSRFDARLDEAAVYAATLYPVIDWHTRLPAASFHWFVPGDFAAGLPAQAAQVARGVWALALFSFYARQIQRALRGEAPQWGKLMLVTTTAAVWWAGIVRLATDFAFTVTNVIAHGVPYMLMSWQLQRRPERPEAARAPGRHGALLASLPLYLATLFSLAFLEEWLWDLGVWNEHPLFFPHVEFDSTAWLNLIVPLLALPQITHYILDAYLWRTDGHNRALNRLLER